MRRIASAPTQVRFPNRTTIRSIFQALIGLAALAPILIGAMGLPAAGGIVGGVLAVSAAVTRVMAIPAVNEFLEKHLPWLAAKPAPAVEAAPVKHDDELDSDFRRQL